MLIRLYIFGCLLFALNKCVLAHLLDWAGATTVFDTSDNELHPAMTTVPASHTMRALCISGSSTLCMKVSTDDGITWGLNDTMAANVVVPRWSAAADRQYVYVLLTGTFY